MAARTVGITGEIARYWIESGMAQTILERSRSEIESRRNLFMELFKDYTFRCEPGSPYAWLQLPEQWGANRFTQALAARNIRVTPESAFDITGSGKDRYIRVCFGGPRIGWQMRRAFEDMIEVMQGAEQDDYTPVA
jgi:DNA-binding transcriptional MocR family regulator